MNRRGFLAGTAFATFGGLACAPAVVKRVEGRPITPDPRSAVLVVIDQGRARYGPVYVGSMVIGGACVSQTHLVMALAPGRQLVVAYDDASYDAAEADLAPGAIYAIEVDHSSGELEINPLVPGRDSIRRLLDETDRVELAHAPGREEIETFERKVRLGRQRFGTYSSAKRAARAIGPAHAWR